MMAMSDYMQTNIEFTVDRTDVQYVSHLSRQENI